PPRALATTLLVVQPAMAANVFEMSAISRISEYQSVRFFQLGASFARYIPRKRTRGRSSDSPAGGRVVIESNADSWNEIPPMPSARTRTMVAEERGLRAK